MGKKLPNELWVRPVASKLSERQPLTFFTVGTRKKGKKEKYVLRILTCCIAKFGFLCICKDASDRLFAPLKMNKPIFYIRQYRSEKIHVIIYLDININIQKALQLFNENSIDLQVFNILELYQI